MMATCKQMLLLRNILAGPLAELSGTISKLVKQGGMLALSGILESQAHSVVEAYKPWFKIESIVEKEEWVRIVAKKL